MFLLWNAICVIICLQMNLNDKMCEKLYSANIFECLEDELFIEDSGSEGVE